MLASKSRMRLARWSRSVVGGPWAAADSTDVVTLTGRFFVECTRILRMKANDSLGALGMVGRSLFSVEEAREGGASGESSARALPKRFISFLYSRTPRWKDDNAFASCTMPMCFTRSCKLSKSVFWNGAMVVLLFWERSSENFLQARSENWNPPMCWRRVNTSRRQSHSFEKKFEVRSGLSSQIDELVKGGPTENFLRSWCLIMLFQCASDSADQPNTKFMYSTTTLRYVASMGSVNCFILRRSRARMKYFTTRAMASLMMTVVATLKRSSSCRTWRSMRPR
mmetsp:Transcript_15339/g.39109  ORF Transcript_15339/g.39109 Transcript_15339/m.39109 type:complete len:282 (-) Transcript_15339:1245-2090(-)